MSRPVIEVRGIVNRFGAQVVHDGLDMDVMEGEVFGIVGGSGSGKSVLLRTILGLQRPVSGSVSIHGRNINSLTTEEMREVKRGYGVTFQHGALFRPDARARLAVVEGIAQGDDGGGLVAAHHLGQLQERGAAVIGRQKLAGAGVRTALFEMHVAHDQGAKRQQIGRAMRIEQHGLAIHLDDQVIPH